MNLMQEVKHNCFKWTVCARSHSRHQRIELKGRLASFSLTTRSIQLRLAFVFHHFAFTKREGGGGRVTSLALIFLFFSRSQKPKYLSLTSRSISPRSHASARA